MNPRKSLAPYLQKNVLVIFLLGISSGFPLALCFGTLTAWLTEAGVNKQSIGLFGALTFPYAIKFLWSPLFDAIKVPYLTKIYGKRRAWLLVTQLFLAASIIWMATTSPDVSPYYTALFALIISFFSASQDINIDAYRVESLTPEEYGYGSAAAVFGYRVGMLFSGAGALYIADFGMSWNFVYLTMSLLVIIGMIGVLLGRIPDAEKEKQPTENHFKRMVIEPFKDFMQKNGWVVFLALVILYKLPDAIMGSLANNFYLELGFTKTEIASVSKVFGFGATLLGSFLGGVMVARFGLYKSLLTGCILQALTVLFFSIQALVGNDLLTLAFTIGLENLGSGIGDICIVVFISNLCSKQFTATQFALLSSLSALGRTFLRSPSGYIAASTGWLWFFAISSATAIPALIILILYKKSINAITAK